MLSSRKRPDWHVVFFLPDFSKNELARKRSLKFAGFKNTMEIGSGITEFFSCIQRDGRTDRQMNGREEK
jgi:hypothetical protein